MPAVHGEFVVELLAQLRNTGRILDGFKFALDCTKALEAYVDLDKILPAGELKGMQALFQSWPRDIKIRRNMMSSAWTSITDSITGNDVDILDEDGAGVTAGSVMQILERLPGDRPVNASTRWAIAAGPDGFLKLQLQCLPLVASVLNNRSTFKSYIATIETCMIPKTSDQNKRLPSLNVSLKFLRISRAIMSRLPVKFNLEPVSVRPGVIVPFTDEAREYFLS